MVAAKLSKILYFAIVPSFDLFVTGFTPPFPNCLDRKNGNIGRIHIRKSHRSRRFRSSSHGHSIPDDDWGMGDSWGDSEASYEDPRVEAMRSMLESSWDGSLMGVIPTSSEKASVAAGRADCLFLASSRLIVALAPF